MGVLDDYKYQQKTGTLRQGDVPVYTGDWPAPPGTGAAPRKPSGPSAQELADRAAARARAEASAKANTAARSGANSSKNQFQQGIDANTAQMAANTSKLTSLQKLITEGLVSSRDTHLGAVDQSLDLILKQTLAHFDTQWGDLRDALRGNEKAEADTSFGNLANRGREKQDLVGQALSQGAGESDVLKTQLQAVRNWDANQGEINRSYYDTLTGVNSAISDLNVGTHTQMTNAELDANAKKANVWGDYYGSVSDSYTQMDNMATNNWLLEGENNAARANMSAQDSLISWMNSGKNAEDYVTPVQAASQRAAAGFDGYADEAADWAGKAWTNPGVSQATKDFTGKATSTPALATTQVWDQQTNTANKGKSSKKAPEGATLRRW